MKTISQYVSKLLNAGPKAKMDIKKILWKQYNSKSYTLKLNGKEDSNCLNQIIYKIRKALFCFIYLRGNDLTVIQFPFINDLRFTKNVKNKVAFIHDLEGIRKCDKRIEDREIEFLKSCKYVVAHNNIMKKYLIEKGIPTDKIYVLELFDYLCDGESVVKEQGLNDQNKKLIYTGNLDKAAFIKQMEADKMNYSINVYGICNEEIKNEKIIYKGKYLPDELPKYLEGDLGLVWDGNFDESDENDGFKNYTRFNNPHKLSCYIAAGKPVIVWRKSAVSEFVLEHNIGYVISNLYDINNIDFSDYGVKKENVKELALKVRKGYFTQNVINKILKEEKAGD